MEESGKKYFTIGEVAAEIGVSVEVLRKWEREFPKKIKPFRTGKGTRLYQRSDIEQIRMIYRMRHNEGRTIKGVQQILERHPGREEVKQEVIAHLQNLRQQLQAIVDEMDALALHAR